MRVRDALGSLSGTGLWKGISQGAQRLCLAASAAPVDRLTAHSTAAHVVTHAGSGGSAHLERQDKKAGQQQRYMLEGVLWSACCHNPKLPNDLCPAQARPPNRLETRQLHSIGLGCSTLQCVGRDP